LKSNVIQLQSKLTSDLTAAYTFVLFCDLKF